MQIVDAGKLGTLQFPDDASEREIQAELNRLEISSLRAEDPGGFLSRQNATVAGQTQNILQHVQRGVGGVMKGVGAYMAGPGAEGALLQEGEYDAARKLMQRTAKERLESM